MIEFDPNKDTLNLKNHGLSLIEAECIDWDTAITWPDARYHYDEERMVGWGMIDGVLHYFAFVERGEVTRFFSLRPAKRKEIEQYVRYYKRR